MRWKVVADDDLAGAVHRRSRKVPTRPSRTPRIALEMVSSFGEAVRIVANPHSRRDLPLDKRGVRASDLLSDLLLRIRPPDRVQER
jgi:hypothetical protein